MIKINLLRNHFVRTRSQFVNPAVTRTGFIFLAIAALTAGFMGNRTFHMHGQVQAGREKRARLRIEVSRLQELRTEISEHARLKQLRQSRIDVIEKLKSDQKGPVLLLNNVIQSIPRDGLLWLTSLTQSAQSIKIVGFTQDQETIPDFMTNLMTCGMFQSVDLENIESDKDASKFSLICITGNKTVAE